VQGRQSLVDAFAVSRHQGGYDHRRASARLRLAVLEARSDARAQARLDAVLRLCLPALAVQKLGLMRGPLRASMANRSWVSSTHVE
jgi:hypothetical protein